MQKSKEYQKVYSEKSTSLPCLQSAQFLPIKFPTLYTLPDFKNIYIYVCNFCIYIKEYTHKKQSKKAMCKYATLCAKN